AERLVDHVPSLDPALVSSDDCVDVVAHALKQNLASGSVRALALKHPVRGLAVPDQAVTDDEHPVLLAELHVAVSRLKAISVGSRARMNASPLHCVLGRDRIELAFNQCSSVGVLFGEL